MEIGAYCITLQGNRRLKREEIGRFLAEPHSQRQKRREIDAGRRLKKRWEGPA